MIQKIKEHILQSLDKAGVLRISAGGGAVSSQHTFRRGGTALIPESLNVNGHSLPLLSALIAAAVAPNFAIRTSEKSLRTSQDKVRLPEFIQTFFGAEPCRSADLRHPPLECQLAQEREGGRPPGHGLEAALRVRREEQDWRCRRQGRWSDVPSWHDKGALFLPVVPTGEDAS